MATITESTTTVVDIDYETPIYRKVGTSVFIMIYDTNKMVYVSTEAGGEAIYIIGFPNAYIKSIANTDSSDQTEYETARDAAKTAIDAL